VSGARAPVGKGAPDVERGVRGWASRYAALVRTAWLVDLQYRAAVGIWLLWGLTEPLISLGIWWSIAGAGPIEGYDRPAFARYFFAVILVNQLTLAWDAYYIDRWIRGGELNHRLARPISPVHEAIADNLAYKGRSAAVVLALWGVTALIWPAVRVPVEPVRWAIAALAIVLAAGIRFLNGYATGLVAFWTTRATALMELQFGISLFLSGRIAPLSLLPPVVAGAAGVLWFSSTLAFPVEVLTGAVTGRAAFARGLLLQLFWLVAWFAAYRFVWRRGIRHYAAVGG
jgi:ABC-2 type transport system permease protein